MNSENVFWKIVILSLGGALGTNARYFLGSWIQNKAGGPFPVGTFAINISGAFILGLLGAVMANHMSDILTPSFKLFLAVGFLGAYTTFSTLEYESFWLASDGSLFLAVLNLVGSMVLGLIAVFLGVQLGKLF